MNPAQLLLISLGWICIALGVLGIFLPLMPTTVFLLIAAWCFARSSERFHSWLVAHPHLGPFIHAWQSGQGLEQGLRNRIIASLWISLTLSALISFYATHSLLLLIIFPLIGFGVSYYIYSLPCYQD